MGLGIDLSGLGSIMTGAGTLAKDIRTAITGDISAEKNAELEAKALELESQAMTAQAEILKAEAASPNMFIAGARPAILWIGALVILYSYVIAPVLVTFGVPSPNIQLGDLWPVITGILGLGTMRSYEKAQGVVSRH
jgi:hypothetical protein